MNMQKNNEWKSVKDYKYVIHEKKENIARITMNKPEMLNAYGWLGRKEDAQDFWSALEDAKDDDDIKVIIFRGKGRAFGVGNDLNVVGFVYGMGTGKKGEKRVGQMKRLKVDREAFHDDELKILLCPKITIAQIDGYCLSGGLSKALACDIAIASEDAIFGFPEQRLSTAGAGVPSMLKLIHSVGMVRALDLLLTGRFIDGKEAMDIGLITKVVPKDELNKEVKKMAEAMCMHSHDSIAIGKAHRHLIYDTLGITAGFAQSYLIHTLGTNIHFEKGEKNFFKDRRDKGVKTAFEERDERFKDLV
jgi:enoyl-CoA hydratase/carnithine racemase